MGTFATIQAEIQRRVVDLPTHVSNDLPAFINRAQRDLGVYHNFRCMRATHTANTTAATHVVGNLPANWKEPRGAPWYAWEDTGQQTFIEWIDEDSQLAQLYGLTDPNDKGPPVHLFARHSEADEAATQIGLEVYPFPDGLSDWGAAPAGEYRLVIPYWKFVADLSGSLSNWFTVNAEEYLIAQAAAHAFMADWDENRAAVWFAQATKAALKAKRIDNVQTKHGRRELVPRADVHGSPRRVNNRFVSYGGWR